MRKAASPIRRTSARCPIRRFSGFGRCGTDPNGDYAFDTIKPGQVPDPDGKPQAPHLLLAIFARGMLLHNYTRIYFDGEAANAADSVLALVPADRRATLIATRKPGNGNAVYGFDIRLQGDDETVFFDMRSFDHRSARPGDPVNTTPAILDPRQADEALPLLHHRMFRRGRLLAQRGLAGADHQRQRDGAQRESSSPSGSPARRR